VWRSPRRLSAGPPAPLARSLGRRTGPSPPAVARVALGRRRRRRRGAAVGAPRPPRRRRRCCRASRFAARGALRTHRDGVQESREQVGCIAPCRRWSVAET